MDVTAVELAVTGGAHILGLLRSTAENLRALGKAEVVNDLLEIQLSMMDVLQKHQSALDENRALRERVTELETLLDKHSRIEPHHNAYWLRVDDESLDGPFSLAQWDTARKLVRMMYLGMEGESAKFYCKVSRETVYIAPEFLRAMNVRSALELLK
jgi:hypothetical protein